MTNPGHFHSDRNAQDSGDETKRRLRRLGLFGLASRLVEFDGQSWVDTLLELEESERQRRGLERRMRLAKLDRFKPIADFDWSWPRKIDRAAIEDLFDLSFLKDATNVVLLGPNGVGKSMIAENLAHHAVMKGFTARYTTASNLLTDLASQEGARALTTRLRAYTKPALLVVDEIGYLSATARDADLLFEVVSRRYEKGSIVVTTNRPLKEWNDVFPSSGCVVTLIDRLCHHSEVLSIDAESYRLKEAKERQQCRRRRKSG
jgi:DNA replication protein DnaC